MAAGLLALLIAITVSGGCQPRGGAAAEGDAGKGTTAGPPSGPAVASGGAPAVADSGAAVASSSTASPQPSVAASAPAPRLPRPAAERPSAHVTRPPDVKAVEWQPLFDTYGRLLDIDDLLDDYHARYPDKTEVVQLATTHEGRSVRALLIADHPAAARGRPSVFLNGAHHGNEPLSGLVVLDAIETLLTRSDSDPRLRRDLAELAIWCVPVVNPDGVAAFLKDPGAGRKNGRETRPEGERRSLRTRGVDLNRNYPFRWGALRGAGSRGKANLRSYRGPEPASEPEVRAIIALSDREHFVASLSFHIGTVALLVPYTIPGVPQPAPNEAWLVAEEIARPLRANGDRPVYVRKNLYPVDGTDQDYHRAAHGTLALLFEAAARNWGTAAKVEQTLAGVRPLWGSLFDRYLEGPSVEGHVRDAAGRPVAARVDVVEVKSHGGESWSSRCQDGFFGRYLPAFGRFTVRVTPAGGAAIDTPVEVAPGKGRVAVDIVVPEGTGLDCPQGGGALKPDVTW